MIGTAEVMAFGLMGWFMCLGVALGGHYGFIGGLGGGVCGAIIGFISGYYVDLVRELTERWLDKLTQKRRFAGVATRLTVFVLVLVVFGGFMVWSSRVVFRSLKEMRAQQRHSALAPMPMMNLECKVGLKTKMSHL